MKKPVSKHNLCMHSSTLLSHTLAERVTGLLASSAPCLACRLAAELESEVPTEGPGEGQTSKGVQEPVPINGEVLERLRGMEQQVQMALLELKKKDQQLAREKSSIGRFKVRHSHKLGPSFDSAHLLCAHSLFGPYSCAALQQPMCLPGT